MEGVVVCTPPEWHSRYVTAALSRRIGVLVEKPGVVSAA
jgi:predicted dehydrogenase